MNRLLILLSFLLLGAGASTAQANNPATPKAEPYKVYTQEKKITIKSTSKINKIMLWTASGHRVAESQRLDTYSWSYTISVNEHIFFLMMETADGKRYTRRIGVR